MTKFRLIEYFGQYFKTFGRLFNCSWASFSLVSATWASSEKILAIFLSSIGTHCSSTNVFFCSFASSKIWRLHFKSKFLTFQESFESHFFVFDQNVKQFSRSSRLIWTLYLVHFVKMLKVKSLLVLLPLCHVAAGWTYLTDSTVETFGTQFQTNVLPMAFTGSNPRPQQFHFLRGRSLGWVIRW